MGLALNVFGYGEFTLFDANLLLPQFSFGDHIVTFGDNLSPLSHLCSVHSF